MTDDEEYRIVDEPEEGPKGVEVKSRCDIGFGLNESKDSVMIVLKVMTQEHVFRLGPQRARELASSIFRAADMTRAEPRMRREVYSVSKTIRNSDVATESDGYRIVDPSAPPQTCTLEFRLFCFDGLVCANIGLGQFGRVAISMPADQAGRLASRIMSLVDAIEGVGEMP